MLSRVASQQRNFGTAFRKVQVANPIVDIDGDEMTRVIWQWIKDRHIHPYVDVKTEYYDQTELLVIIKVTLTKIYLAE